jgi:hypothetical protein
MQILIEPGGNVRCVYCEAINLSKIGQLTISRGSHVEPDEQRRRRRVYPGPRTAGWTTFETVQPVGFF